MPCASCGERPASSPRVILLSAFCTDQILSEARELGVSYFMPKPCTVDALLDRMHTVFAMPAAAPVDRSVSLKNLVTSVIHEIGVPPYQGVSVFA